MKIYGSLAVGNAQRRGFLKSCTMVMLSCLVPNGAIGVGPAHFRSVACAERRWRPLLELFDDRHAACEIGDRYLKAEPDEKEPARAFAEFVVSEQVKHRIDPRTTLCEQRERDFVSDQVVVIDGWLLARTEARLCALASLCRNAENVS